MFKTLQMIDEIKPTQSSAYVFYPFPKTKMYDSSVELGYLDEEGFLFLCDRKADMIISGGVNIYPAEIEGVLMAHPAVADIAVFGIPNDDWGEQVHAIIELAHALVSSL